MREENGERGKEGHTHLHMAVAHVIVALVVRDPAIVLVPPVVDGVDWAQDQHARHSAVLMHH